jgi:DNA-binding response OmpR family regulator
MPTALIVEDEPEANKLLAMLVQLRGYSTESAFTGSEALERIRVSQPDIVFLDLMLPDINGFEVCKSLKARKSTCLIPVVMVTARVADENRIASFGLGADDYIPKPYIPDQIFQALSDASSWRNRVSGRLIEGVIPLDQDSEQEGLRRLGQLRNLLVARTTLDHDAIDRIMVSLKEIRNEGLSWAQGSRRPLNASLNFRIEPDRLEIALRDASGWLADNPFATEEDGILASAAAGFDEVFTEEAGRRISFRKRFLPSDSLPS